MTKYGTGTTKDFLREFATKELKHGELFYASDAVEWFAKNYPKIKYNTVEHHVKEMAVNNPVHRKNHPHIKPSKGWDLFWKVNSKQYRLWNPEVDPDPVYGQDLQVSPKEDNQNVLFKRFINNAEELTESCLNFKQYLESNDNYDSKKAKTLLKNNKRFVALESNGQYILAPGSYAAYFDCSIAERIQLRKDKNCNGSNEYLDKNYKNITADNDTARHEQLARAYFNFCKDNNVVPSIHKREIDFWVLEKATSPKVKTTGTRNKIPNHAIEQAYHLAKRVFDDNDPLTLKDALSQVDMNQGSAQDYILNFQKLRDGIKYTRTINPYGTEFYLKNILNDYGHEGLRKALSALYQHLEYYADLENGSAQKKNRDIYNRYLQNLNSDIENAKDIQVAEDIKEILSSSSIDQTEKEQQIQARIGQGKFRERVTIIANNTCCVTGVNNPDLLIASHIKPWRNSTSEERLDGYNGLLLAPHIDKLFDRGYISFEDNGDMLVSDYAQQAIQQWKVLKQNVGAFHAKQQVYLKLHRDFYHSKNK